jgi:protein gp37
MQKRRFARVGNEDTTGITLHWDRLNNVPRGPKVFTPSLGDLFHEDVPLDFIHQAFQTMERHDATPDEPATRIFQVLTKRPERARDVLRWLYTCHWCDGGGCGMCDAGMKPPLNNVWVGVSIENARYTWRADVLREIPAAVRFISAEPLLSSLFPPPCTNSRCRDGWVAYEPNESGAAPPIACRVCSGDRRPLDLSGIDWVIIGGESGPNARPFHLEHAREIIRAARTLGGWQCTRDGVTQPCGRCDGCRSDPMRGCRPAVFVKQFGAKPVERTTYSSLPIRRNLRDRKGGDPSEWPADLRIREFPQTRTEEEAA